MATVVVRGTRRNRPPIIVYFAFPEAIDIRLLANARDSTDLKRISLGPFRWRQLFYRFRRENGLGLLARECLGRVQLFLLRKHFRSLYGLYFLRGCSNATTSSHGRGRVKSWIRTIWRGAPQVSMRKSAERATRRGQTTARAGMVHVTGRFFITFPGAPVCSRTYVRIGGAISKRHV